MEKIKILVVEDESVTALDIKNVLTQLDYNVVGLANSGEEAISMANDLSPDLILMDIMLAGEMDGIDAAKIITEKKPIPIIFLTAYVDDDTYSRAKLTAPYSFLSKPFQTSVVKHSIELALCKESVLKEKLQIEKIKQNFLAIASHELRTPLTGIFGSLTLLLGGDAGELPEAALELLTLAQRNAERLIRLINDILDVEKSGTMEFILKNTDINLIVEESVLLSMPYANKFGCKLSLTKEANALVNVDPDRLLQVLTNLISNAVKFSTSGSNVELTISPNSNDGIRVSIKNQGIGISKDFQTRIFQKFAQAYVPDKTVNLGTGLGLAISKEIMEKLQGSIDYDSEPGKETTFYIDLPVVKFLPIEMIIHEKPSTLLVCENEKLTANQLKYNLEENAFKVIMTNKIDDAKVILTQSHIDGVLLDEALLDNSDLSFISSLQVIYHKVKLPILIITDSKAAKINRLTEKGITIFDWIIKPIVKQQLISSSKKIHKQIEVNTPTILHIENDGALIEEVTNLVGSKVNIIAAKNIQQVNEALAKKHFDLILLDLEFYPGLAEVLSIIANKHIPTLLFTAFDLPKKHIYSVVDSLLVS